MKPRENRYIYHNGSRNNKPWRVMLSIENKDYNVGYFRTVEEARVARDEFIKNRFSLSIPWQRKERMHGLTANILKLVENLETYNDITTCEVAKRIRKVKKEMEMISKLTE